MVYLRQQLHVDTETAVEVRPWLGNQSLRELLLEHQHSAPEDGLLGEQFEDEGRADLVGYIGDADVEEGKLDCEYISRY